MRRIACAVAIAVVPAARAEYFSKRYKVVCPDSETGCACVSHPEKQDAVVRFTHGQVARGKSGADESARPDVKWVEIDLGDRTCFLRQRALTPIMWHDETCPQADAYRNLPFASPEQFLARGSVSAEKTSLGVLFPTFYNIADESHFGGPKTEALHEDGTGALIARVSSAFRAALDMEGTGLLSDGRTLNVGTRVSGRWRYVVLPQGSFGLGIEKRSLYPYRVAAVDFDHLCQKAGLGNCGDTAANRKRLVGSLLFIPGLAGARMPNGSLHDGFVCAHDIGGGIKVDRIDLFVGPMGGGNPYLPACQSTNAYTEHGIESLVPSDWKLWKESAPGKYQRVNPYEYRTTAPGKGLEVLLVKGASCRPEWP